MELSQILVRTNVETGGRNENLKWQLPESSAPVDRGLGKLEVNRWQMVDELSGAGTGKDRSILVVASTVTGCDDTEK